MNFFINIFIEYATLPIILLIGILVSIDDYKEGKIRNKWILLGIYLGLIYYAIIIILTILGHWQIIPIYLAPSYYLDVLLNVLLAFILAFTLWYFKLWAGGDAKLFTLYVFLIPLGFYSQAYLKYFPAFNLLVNIIIPIFVYLIFKMLLYPIQLGINYLRQPALLKKYYQEYKVKNKIDKKKIKGYLSAGASFLLILVFFQLLRSRLGEFLSPYLGNLLTVGYFFMGFVLFKPLRAVFQKRVILVSILILLYIIGGAIYFPQIVFSDFHKLFALQLIFMLSYFYIFKFAKTAGQFIYNSAEVKVIPLAELEAGVYINKDYVKRIMGDRTNIDLFQKEIENKLETEEKTNLFQLIKIKTDKVQKEKSQYQIISLLQNLRLEALPGVFKLVWQYKNQRETEKVLLEKINIKLTEAQKQTLDNILNNTDEVKNFLKTISGKLTDEQAKFLKEMINKRNKEVIASGAVPIDKIILHKTFSFAPFMLLGVLITLITKNSLLHLFFQLVLHK